MNNFRCTLLLALIGCFSLANGQTCPSGLSVFFDPSTNAAVPCNSIGGCPFGTYCRSQPLNPLALQNLCCRSTPAVTSCSEGEILIGGQCFAKALPGQPCKVLGQCSGGTTCTGNICQ